MMIWNVQTKVSHEQIDGNSLCPTPYLGENTKIVFLTCDSLNLWTSSILCEYLKSVCMCASFSKNLFSMFTHEAEKREYLLLPNAAQQHLTSWPHKLRRDSASSQTQYGERHRIFFQFPKGPPSWGVCVNRPFFLSRCHFTRSISISLI